MAATPLCPVLLQPHPQRCGLAWWLEKGSVKWHHAPWRAARQLLYLETQSDQKQQQKKKKNKKNPEPFVLEAQHQVFKYSNCCFEEEGLSGLVSVDAEQK